MNQESSSSHRLERRRALTIGAVVMTLAVLGTLAADLLTPDHGDSVEVTLARGTSAGDGEPQPSPTGAASPDGSAVAEQAATPTPEAFRPELGLEAIVREFTALFRGGETLGAPMPEFSSDAKLKSEDPQTRRRGEFEQQIQLEFIAHYSADPHAPLLFESSMDDWSSCLKEHGLPGLEELGKLSEEEQQKMFDKIELSDRQISELAGLEDRCWEKARVYEGKDDETDRLLGLQHQYYLSVAQEWVKANPESAIPLAN